MVKTMRTPRRDRFTLMRATPFSTARGLRARLSFLCTVVSVLALLASAAAVRAEVANPNGVALIIGNTGYEHRDVPDVTFAHRDADAFRSYVVEVLGFAPENIIDLRDARRRQLFDALGTRVDPRSLLWSYLDPDGASDVVVFYSGHGVPGVNDKRGYLLPVDADPKAAEDDGYPIDLLYRNVGGLAEARSVRVYLDACFSGGSGDGATLIRDASPVFVEAALPAGLGEKVTSLAAATGKQVASWDEAARHGLFTHHLLDALYGKADADGDGEVTAREAKGYLDRYMTRAARRQHRRVQQASLIGAQDVVVASAGVGGEFPQRPGLGDTATAPATTDAEETPAKTEAGVTQAPAPAEEAPLTLTRADRRLVQAGLLAAGLDVGVVDGLFGPRTEGAIRAYQEKKGWPETGKLTREQAEALMALGREWQAERRRLAEEALLETEAEEKERARLAEERRKAEAERRRQEEARLNRERREAERRERERASREPGRRFRDCAETWCPEMVVVPSGSFMMGSPSDEEGRWDAEGPRHRVRIGKPFAVGVTEVTRGEFGRFVRETGHSTGNACWTYEDGEWEERSGRSWRNPGYSQTDAHPVVCVSWEDARAYVRWLSRETGERYRLPSESEWEYVARAGTSTAWYWGPSESGQCRHANGADRALKRRYSDWEWPTASCDDGHVHTAPVGSYAKNGYGLHDVSGNVWEWVEDCWNESYTGAPSNGSVWTSGDCSRRVLRGGSWYFRPQFLRSANRYGNPTGDRYIYVGFRVARTLD